MNALIPRIVSIQIRNLADIALYLPKDIKQFTCNAAGAIWVISYPNPDFK